jgi:MurNAc alpha-1-phosphate uridylyltransferase
MNVMIFAAGLGTRMHPLTDTTAKALIPVAGRALMDHALEQARAAAPDRIVVNAHHHAAQIESHLAAQLDVRCVVEPGPLLETGGGLRNALPLLGPDPVMTLNADAVWTGPAAAKTLAAAWDPARMDGLLLLVPLARTHGRKGGGDFSIAADGALERDPIGMVYTGAGIVRTEGLADIENTVFSLRDLWAPMAAARRLHGVIHPGHWADVGHPAGILEAEAMLQAEARQ